jgi:peptide/nickel transport system ATP-binding protein
MTQLGVTAQPPATGTPLLEAQGLTKHFPVHGTVPRIGGGPGGRRALWGARRLARGGGDGTAAKKVVHAVENVSLALAEAQVTAVVGESGSGKSTLARLLARLLKPTSGTLLVDGHPVPPASRGGGGGARRGEHTPASCSWCCRTRSRP